MLATTLFGRLVHRLGARSRLRAIGALSLGLLVLGVVATGWSFVEQPLPSPPPWSAALPPASPPPSMAIYQLPTGVYRTNAALAFRGGSPSETRELSAIAILVRHPRGDLLFDAGFGTDVAGHVLSLPRFQRAPFVRTETVRARLNRAGYDIGSLRGIVVTHSHWDHVSGIADLPVPIWMNAAERRFANAGGPDQVFQKVSAGHEIREYEFDGPPYLGFPSSHDVWGDGSVVLVPAPGHTSGSIIAFLALPEGPRYALIGDLTWQLDGVEKRAERPWLLRAVADVDAARVREDLLRVIALAGRYRVVPAHDARAFADIPLLR